VIVWVAAVTKSNQKLVVPVAKIPAGSASYKSELTAAISVEPVTLYSYQQY